MGRILFPIMPEITPRRIIITPTPADVHPIQFNVFMILIFKFKLKKLDSIKGINLKCTNQPCQFSTKI